MFTNKVSTAALTFSSLLMMSVTPAYAITNLNIVADYNVSNVVNDLIAGFEGNFCLDPSSTVGELTCQVNLEIRPSADIRDLIVDSSPEAAYYDLFISSNQEPSDLYNKYQFSHPNVAVGKPFEFASDSVILLSAFPGPGIDVSSGIPKHLAKDVKFAMPDPVTDAYGAVSAQILARSPNLKSALGHVQTTVNAVSAYAGVTLYDPIEPFGFPFGFVAKSAACWETKMPESYSVYDFSQQENLKEINSIKVTGVSIGRKRSKEEEALVNAFISYITGQSNGNGNANTAAYVLQDEYCYVPITAKKETKVQPH
jgi:hypothetical protein